MPSGFRFARHPLDGPADAARAHRQSETLLENGGGIGVGQALGLVHQHSQGDGLRSHLHRRCPDGVRGLQRVPALHPLLTLVTTADGNVEAPHPGAAHDLFLVLRFHPLEGEWPPAVGALRWSVDLDLFVYMLRDRPLMVGAMGLTGLAPRRFGIVLRLAARERSGLAFASTQRGFQFVAQSLILLPQALQFLVKSLLLPFYLLHLFAGLIALPSRTPQLLHEFAYATHRIQVLEKQTIFCTEFELMSSFFSGGHPKACFYWGSTR